MLSGAIFYLVLTLVLQSRRLALDEFFFKEGITVKSAGVVALSVIGMMIWASPGLGLLYWKDPLLLAVGLPAVAAAFLLGALRWRWVYLRRSSVRGRRQILLHACRAFLAVYGAQLLIAVLLWLAAAHDGLRGGPTAKGRALDASLTPFVGFWSMADLQPYDSPKGSHGGQGPAAATNRSLPPAGPGH